MGKRPVQGDPTTKLWVKIVCGFLGFMMVFGILVMVFSAFQSSAIESESSVAVPDQQISVGLYCNENAVQSYALTAENGFTVAVGSTALSVSLPSPQITATVDNNLYRVGSNLYTESGGIATVGGYHIEISYFTFADLGIDTDHDNPVFIRPGNSVGTTDGYAPSTVHEYIEMLSDDNTFKALSLYAFPYYASAQKCYIRVGSFFTRQEAEEVLAQLERTIAITAKIAEPGQDTISILGEDYSILCELYGKDQDLYVSTLQSKGMRSIGGPAYDGTIQISSYNGSGRQRLNIVNRLSLETYISILLPSEVYSGWNIELLKSMAVLLRTEITRKLGSHAKEGYDLCAESHCHTYIGAAEVSQPILDAVSETAGQILTYEGELIYTPYSMTVGSGTLSSADAFGTYLPYLSGIYTPWEEAEDWTVEFTPYELYRLLNGSGYGQISGNIASVTVNCYAEHSDYVNSITFTDLFGNAATIEGSEAIRLLFGGKLPSTCFVVGLAGETAERPMRKLSGSSLDYTESVETITLSGTYGSFVFCGRGSGCGVGFSVMGAKKLAEMGLDYKQILLTYFPNVKVSSADSEEE